MGQKAAGQLIERHTAQRARLSPHKPPPPVTDCRKCTKIAIVRRNLQKALREIARRDDLESARTAEAAAGEPINLSDEQVADKIRARYSPVLDEMLDVPVQIARSPMATASDRRLAAKDVIERLAGMATQKIDHRVKIIVDVSAATDEELDIVFRANQIIERLTRKEAA